MAHFIKQILRKKEIYLTFDNGYENGYTAQILDVLKKEKVPATFFVTGHYLETAPDLSETNGNRRTYCWQSFMESP